MVALSIPELSVHANGCVWIFACTRISLVEKRCNAGIKDFVNGKPEICNLGSIYGIYIYMAFSENSVPSKACCSRGYDSRYVSEV